MLRTSTIVVFVLMVMSCSEDVAPREISSKREHALELASAKCGGSFSMPWLRQIIQTAESDTNAKGEIYAIETVEGVVFLYQPWISSCFGCLTYRCGGDKVLLGETAMNQVIQGAVGANLIFSSFN